MKQSEIIEFFDRQAPGWDASMIRDDALIDKILDQAGVKAGADVLDVACGTGVLIPDYQKRGVASVTGIDISGEMLKRAKEKFPDVTFLCGDVEKWQFDRLFDCIVIYNAFPHFPEPERLIDRMAGWLKPGAVLTVAHGMSRERINHHHEGAASKVSLGLMEAEQLAQIFAKHLRVTTVISDEKMYQVCGVKEEELCGQKFM